MLVDELTKMTPEVRNRLLSRDGIIMRGLVGLKEKKEIKSKRSTHKKVNGFTERQHFIIDYFDDNKETRPAMMAKYIGVDLSAISTIMKPLLKKGVVSYCKKTKIYSKGEVTKEDAARYNPMNKRLLKYADLAKKLNTFKCVDLLEISKNKPHWYLNKLIANKLVEKTGFGLYQWIGE